MNLTFGYENYFLKQKNILYLDQAYSGKAEIKSRPAAVEIGATMLIVPLTPLRHEMAGYAMQLRISVTDFRFPRIYESTNSSQGLVVCSSKEVRFKKRLCYCPVQALYRSKRLNWFVVDEAYLSYMSERYIESMYLIEKMRLENINIPVVFLSATVPKYMEKICFQLVDVISSDRKLEEKRCKGKTLLSGWSTWVKKTRKHFSLLLFNTFLTRPWTIMIILENALSLCSFAHIWNLFTKMFSVQRYETSIKIWKHHKDMTHIGKCQVMESW